MSSNQQSTQHLLGKKKSQARRKRSKSISEALLSNRGRKNKNQEINNDGKDDEKFEPQKERRRGGRRLISQDDFDIERSKFKQREIFTPYPIELKGKKLLIQPTRHGRNGQDYDKKVSIQHVRDAKNLTLLVEYPYNMDDNSMLNWKQTDDVQESLVATVLEEKKDNEDNKKEVIAVDGRRFFEKQLLNNSGKVHNLSVRRGRAKLHSGQVSLDSVRELAAKMRNFLIDGSASSVESVLAVFNQMVDNYSDGTDARKIFNNAAEQLKKVADRLTVEDISDVYSIVEETMESAIVWAVEDNEQTLEGIARMAEQRKEKRDEAERKLNQANDHQSLKSLLQNPPKLFEGYASKAAEVNEENFDEMKKELQEKITSQKGIDEGREVSDKLKEQEAYEESLLSIAIDSLANLTLYTNILSPNLKENVVVAYGNDHLTPLKIWLKNRKE